MRIFLIDHLPTLASWLSIGVGIINRKGAAVASSGGGGASFPDNATSANEFLILFI